MLIKGADLNPDQRRAVLAAFVHRWTHENAVQTYRGQCPGCVQSGGNREIVIPAGQQAAGEVRKMWHDHHVPLTTDAEWLAAHAFHFTKDGLRLMGNRKHAEPVYMADHTRQPWKGRSRP
jgi:hypothetical protein